MGSNLIKEGDSKFILAIAYTMDSQYSAHNYLVQLLRHT